MEADDFVVKETLFGSGRPLSVVPYIQKDELKLGRVTVYWNGSRTAARAVADSVPFLIRSKAIDLLVVEGKRRKRDEIPGFDMAQHLVRHGLALELKRICSSAIEVGNAILSFVVDSSSNFIVMGCSPFRFCVRRAEPEKFRVVE